MRLRQQFGCSDSEVITALRTQQVRRNVPIVDGARTPADNVGIAPCRRTAMPVI